MCTEPILIDQQPVACRHCDACLNARIVGWTHRAMAERAIAQQTMVICLTYADLKGGVRPVGSTVFRYADVQRFLKLLRERYFRHYGERGEIRYMVAGERGSRGTKRIHWHIVLFSDRDLICLGDWREFPSRKALPFQAVKTDTNVIWSLWPHGHVRLQVPDQKGMWYVCKYICEDQRTSLKSRHRARESKSVLWSASMFMMSKKPPIGDRYLIDLLARLRARDAVLPSLQLRLPDMNGFWSPVGRQREFLVDGFAEIARSVRAKYGVPPAAWSALLASVTTDDPAQTDRDYERLVYGPPVETEETRAQSLERGLEAIAGDLRSRETGAERRADAVYWGARCGGSRPCRSCWNALSGEEQDQISVEYRQRYSAWCAYEGRETVCAIEYDEYRSNPAEREALKHRAFDRWWHTHGEGCATGCKGRAQSTSDKVRWYRAIRRFEEAASRKAATSGGPGGGQAKPARRSHDGGTSGDPWALRSTE